jgi:hypothetical protein
MSAILKDLSRGMSHSIRSRFVKDCDLPIQLVQSPYFEYFIYLYDLILPSRGDVINRFVDFIESVDKCGGEEAFFKYDSDLKSRIISHVLAKPEYVAFSQDKITSSDFSKFPGFVKSKNLYCPDNDGGHFLSLDLVSGNFRALLSANPEIVDGKHNYVQFMEQFTDQSHFIHSKQIRQYIFGNLSPKRQTLVEKEIMLELYMALMNVFDESLISCSSHDELVLSVSDSDLSKVDKAISSVEERYSYPEFPLVHRERFELHKIPGTKFYVKKLFGGGFEFKCIPSYLFAQVAKRYLGQKINDFDMSFSHEGRVARFLEPYFVTDGEAE